MWLSNNPRGADKAEPKQISFTVSAKCPHPIQNWGAAHRRAVPSVPAPASRWKDRNCAQVVELKPQDETRSCSNSFQYWALFVIRCRHQHCRPLGLIIIKGRNEYRHELSISLRQPVPPTHLHLPPWSSHQPACSLPQHLGGPVHLLTAFKPQLPAPAAPPPSQTALSTSQDLQAPFLRLQCSSGHCGVIQPHLQRDGAGAEGDLLLNP